MDSASDPTPIQPPPSPTPSADPRAWQPPAPELLAEWLPQYRVDRLIGRGGMGAVYHGVQTALDREVAIKILPAEIADEEFTARFEREARTLARLQHPGVVAIYGFGRTTAGHLYFAMEFVDGTDLTRVIRDSALDCGQTLELTVQICDALHYAHRQGVIHRDIKPANILITRDGRAKLADFGLARPVDDLRGALTQPDIVMGTPAYMAPEQRQGRADARADIYALGVLLYEMLTGLRPRGMFEPPSATGGVDARLDEVVRKAMQQEPERRYQDVGELRTEVDRIRTSSAAGAATPARPPGAATRLRRALRSNALSAAAAVILPVAALAGLFAWNRDHPRATPAKETPTSPSPPASAPPKAGGGGSGWTIVRHLDHDYVTAGNIRDFYRFQELRIENDVAWFKSPNLIIKAAVGSQDLLINNILFVMAFPVARIDDVLVFSRLDLAKLIDPVIRPSYIRSAETFDTVVVDAGYGGPDTGGNGIHATGKETSLQCALALQADLGMRGLKVVLTRQDDRPMPVSRRVAIANETPGSIFISLRFNTGGPSDSGVETFALTPQGAPSAGAAGENDPSLNYQGNRLDSQNIALATAIHSRVVHRFQRVDRGIKRARTGELTGLERPGVVFVGGFLTHPQEARLLAAETYRRELARVIGDGILNYRRALKRG